jgi:hypothetical protein
VHVDSRKTVRWPSGGDGLDHVMSEHGVCLTSRSCSIFSTELWMLIMASLIRSAALPWQIEFSVCQNPEDTTSGRAGR